MIEPKPLTKNRREEIAEKMAIIDWFNAHPAHPIALEFIRDLLAAEQFWREAVKRMQPECDEGDDGSHYIDCPLCGVHIYHDPHKPDCPWLLAQE